MTKEMLKEMQRRIRNPLREMLSREGNQIFEKGKSALTDMVRTMIKNKRQEGFSDNDNSILAHLLRRSENPNSDVEVESIGDDGARQAASAGSARELIAKYPFSDDDLVDECMTFVVRVHPNPASILDN